MAKYRAIVSIEFDDEDLGSFLEQLDINPNEANALDDLNGCLDNLPFGTSWIEQLFVDGRPSIIRLSGGIMVEVNDHDRD